MAVVKIRKLPNNSFCGLWDYIIYSDSSTSYPLHKMEKANDA